MQWARALDAFSVDEKGNLFYWRKDMPKIIEVGMQLSGEKYDGKVFRIPRAGGISTTRPGMYSLQLARRNKEIRRCAAYIDGSGYIDRIVENRREGEVAWRILKVTSVKEQGKTLIVRCHMKNAKGIMYMEELVIENSISDYEKLKKLFTGYMNHTKDLCLYCGGLVENGICKMCGKKDVALMNRSKLNIGWICVVVGVLLFVTGLIGVIYCGVKDTGGPLSVITYAGAFVGVLTGCIGAGIIYKNKL